MTDERFDEYRSEMKHLVEQYRRAALRLPDARSEAVHATKMIAQRLQRTVDEMTSSAVEAGASRVEEYINLYGDMDLYTFFEDGACRHCVSVNPEPDAADFSCAHSMLTMLTSLSVFGPGFDLWKRCHEAIGWCHQSPAFVLAWNQLVSYLEPSAFDFEDSSPPVEQQTYASPPTAGDESLIGLEELLSAMFAKRNSWANNEYWDQYVYLALEEFGLTREILGSPWVVDAYDELTTNILPFPGLLEGPTEVGKAIDAVNDRSEVEAQVVELQRRFMRQLILAHDSSLASRTIRLGALRDRGLTGDPYFDSDVF